MFCRDEAPINIKLKKSHSQKDQNFVFKTDYRLMQVKNIAECSKGHSAILSTFIKLPFAIKIFVSSGCLRQVLLYVIWLYSYTV